MTASIISIKNLSHTFMKGSSPIINSINMEVPELSIYGLLGQNGSGKTTILRLILGLLKIQAGSIRIFGRELKQDRLDILNNIGSLIESPSLYPHLTAEENLRVYYDIYGVPRSRIGEVLELVRLTNTNSKTVKNFSLGMKQRLALAMALLPMPRLLILDEPTNGLDPGGIVEFREIIRRINVEKGITIIISSHILSEMEKLVSHVGIISESRMVFEGSLSELKKSHRDNTSLEELFITLTSTTI